MSTKEIQKVGVLTTALAEALAGGELPPVIGGAEAQAQIVAQILAAATVEEVFDNEGTVATMKMVGETVTLRDVALRPSSIVDNEQTVYAILDVVTNQGELKILNTGSPRIMAQACRAKDLGALPLEVRIVEVARAQPGRNAPLGLELVKG